MILAAVIWLAAAEPNESPRKEPRPTYEAAFAPLKRSEREYARLGPAGPYYPRIAADAHKNGEAILDCIVMADGALNRCSLVSERPKDYNFEAAALMLAKRQRIRAVGASSGERALVRVPFTLGAPAQVEP